jgi:hypothetical protein
MGIRFLTFSQADGMEKEALGLARGECRKWPFPAGLVGTEQALEHGPRYILTFSPNTCTGAEPGRG